MEEATADVMETQARELGVVVENVTELLHSLLIKDVNV